MPYPTLTIPLEPANPTITDKVIVIVQLLYGVPSFILMVVMFFVIGLSKSYKNSFYRLVQLDLATVSFRKPSDSIQNLPEHHNLYQHLASSPNGQAPIRSHDSQVHRIHGSWTTDDVEDCAELLPSHAVLLHRCAKLA